MAKLIDLKAYWLVSMQAVFEHAYRLGRISARQRRSFYTRMNKLGYRKQEPFDIPDEEPSLVRQVIEVHRNEHRHSIAELSAMAHLYEAEFRATFLGEEGVRS